LSAAEVVHLLRAEMESAHGAPELNIGAAEKEYVIEEDFDRSAYGIQDGEQFDLVKSITTLTVEPRVESGYWILETVIERQLGPILISQLDELTRKDLTLDAFEVALRAPGKKRVTVRLIVETSDIKQDFDRWLADMRARHPWKTEQHSIAPSAPSSDLMQAAETERVKEAIGVFRDPGALEAAVGALEAAGFDRAAMSVFATNAKAIEHVRRFFGSVKDVEDWKRVPRAAFILRESPTEGEAEAFGIPIFVGGFAGAAAVAAAGGALALAITAAAIGAAAGAGVGGILAATIAHHCAARVQEQLVKGGLILWVNVPNADAEKRAVAILKKMDAGDVHVNEIELQWSPSGIPLLQPQPEPPLGKDRL